MAKLSSLSVHHQPGREGEEGGALRGGEGEEDAAVHQGEPEDHQRVRHAPEIRGQQEISHGWQNAFRSAKVKGFFVLISHLLFF